jgi:HPt (histidine-containing phosphotransfer) domain-containing protein
MAYTLAESIRQEEGERGRIPILALTANALRGEANRARSMGMDEYLTKPIQLHRLRVELEKWLPQVDGATPHPRVEPAEGRRVAPLVDVAVLEGLVGHDPAAVNGLLSQYLAAAERLSCEMRAAFAAGDLRKVGTVAHKLKSASRSVGALALGDLCAELENAGMAGSSADIAQCMPRLEDGLSSVETEITGLLAS